MQALLIYASLVATAIAMVTTWAIGRSCALHLGDFEVSTHKVFARVTLLCMMITVAIVEYAVHNKGGATFDAPLIVHLVFAVLTLLTLLLLNTLLSGERMRSKNHGRVAFFCLSTFAFTVITGVYLVQTRL